MPPDPTASPVALPPIVEARRVVESLMQAWRARYGEVVCELALDEAAAPATGVEAKATRHPSDAAPSAMSRGLLRLRGEVLVVGQRDALLRALNEQGWATRDELRVLAEVEGEGAAGAVSASAWVRPNDARLELWASPRGETLATEWLTGDPPLRVLARREPWLALQAADGTVGWARLAEVLPLDQSQAPEPRAWRAGFRGSWTAPVAGAWHRAAQAWLGTPYRWGGASRDGADCSGYLQRLVRAVAGLGLPKHSGDQARSGRRVPLAQAAPGDLLYLSHRMRRIPHVALLVEPQDGLPLVTHANLDGGGVCIETLDALLERYALRGVRRLAGEPDEAGAALSDASPRSIAGRPPGSLHSRHSASAPDAAGVASRAAGAAAAAPAEQSVALADIALPLQRDPAAGWAWLEGLRQRRIHVIGYTGSEGAAVSAFLWQHGCRHLVLHDLSEAAAASAAFAAAHVGLPKGARQERWEALAALPVERRHGAEYLRGVGDEDEIFVGQAWYLYPRNLALLEPLALAGKPLHSLMELYFALSGAPIVAVSGSNGKSTTSRWIEHLLRQPDADPRLGRIFFAGNDRHGVQVAESLPTLTAADRLILEVSNRHLRALEPRPEVAVLTNILPNHLEEHGGSLTAYQEAKARLVLGQDQRGRAVWNADDPLSRELTPRLRADAYAFSLQGPVERGAWEAEGRLWLRLDPALPPLPLLPTRALALPGAHNRANALAAALGAALAGATLGQLRRGLGSFEGLRHRLQWVWQVGGIDCFDDLNSTTPQATAAALEALARPVVLIAGGDDKGLDLSGLATTLASTARAVILLPGPGSDRLAEALAKGGPRTLRCERLVDAVREGLALAQAGDALLLSPSLPGFFSLHYRVDGREEGYRAILRRLSGGRASPVSPTDSKEPGS